MNSADRIAELEARLEDLEGRLFDLEPFPPRDAAYALLDTLDNSEDVAIAIDILTRSTVQSTCGEHAAVFAAKVLKSAQDAVKTADTGDVCQSCQDKEAAAPVALTLAGAEVSN